MGHTWGRRDDRPQLLVSVRTAAEARAAVAGGADIIDVKEPRRGPLGMASPDVWREVAAAVVGTGVRLTAALGDLPEHASAPPQPPRDFILLKVGLAGCADVGWQDDWRRFWRALPGFDRAAVAYADWPQCNAPSTDEVAQLAVEEGVAVFLIDTWGKDGGNLLDWLDEPALRRIKGRLDEAHIALALAGSLGTNEIRRLLPLQPDVIAVRGAACRGGHRDGEVHVGAVRELATLLVASS